MSTSPAPGVGVGRSATARCLYSESSRAFMRGGNPSRGSGYSRKPPATAEGFGGITAPGSEENSGAEGGAAAACTLHVRVLELETGRFQGFYVVHYATVQVHQGSGVDENLQVVKPEHFVHHAGLIFKGHGVLEAGTSAAHYANAQTGWKGILRRHNLPH